MHPYELLSNGHRAWHKCVRGQQRLPGTTISVGNLTWGGNGKTPLCEWIARSKGVDRTAVLTRGYKGGDEACMLRSKGIIVGEGADRFKAATEVLRRHPDVCTWVLDDGLQHWALCRDVDIVTIDATKPWGENGRLIPLGCLRERPEKALVRADAVVLHNADLVSRDELSRLTLEVVGLSRPKMPIVNSILDLQQPNDRMKKREWIVLSGIGNNIAFQAKAQALARRMDSVVVAAHSFRDHHIFTPREVTNLMKQDAMLVTTEKDGARCPWLLGPPFNAECLKGEWRLRGGDIAPYNILVHTVAA